jgi:hypothetical protein
MHETLRGHGRLVSNFSAVLKGTALAALTAGLSLPALGQTTPGATTTNTGPSALFCTVPTTLPSQFATLGATDNTGAPIGAGATSTGTSSTAAIPGVTGSLIPNQPGTTLSCGTIGGTQNLQNLSFVAEGIVPADFVLSSVALTLPNDIFSGLATGTNELRSVVSLSGNTMTISLFTSPSTAQFPTQTFSGLGGALSVTPAGSLLSQFTMRVSNVIVTDGSTPTMLFSGVANENASSTTTGAGAATGTGMATGTGSTTATGTVGMTNPSGAATGTTTSGGGMATAAGLVPNLFGNQGGRAAAVSLAFNSPIQFPGLGTTGVVTGATAFGPQTFNASMMQVMVAGSFVLAAPTASVTFNVPPTPAAFQTQTGTTTGTGATTGATTGTGTGTGGI